METIVNIMRLIRAHIKCLFLKIINGRRFNYSKLLRMDKNVRIIIRGNSTINLNGGLLINGNTVISATDGGSIMIGKNVGINRNSMIMCHESISIGDNTIMGPSVYIYDHDHKFDSQEGVCRNDFETTPIKIGCKCWIGANTLILKGTVLGDNCLVAAGSIVKGVYPNGSVIIQKRTESVVQK